MEAVPRTLEGLEVDSPRGQRILALLKLLDHYRPESPPSRRQVMAKLGWDEDTLQQALDDYGVVMKAVASVKG